MFSSSRKSHAAPPRVIQSGPRQDLNERKRLELCRRLERMPVVSPELLHQMLSHSPYSQEGVSLTRAFLELLRSFSSVTILVLSRSRVLYKAFFTVRESADRSGVSRRFP